jgi:septin family protein
MLPFAVVGSEGTFGKIQGRKYPWGIVDVFNQDHCDLIHLRNCLFKYVN